MLLSLANNVGLLSYSPSTCYHVVREYHLTWLLAISILRIQWTNAYYVPKFSIDSKAKLWQDERKGYPGLRGKKLTDSLYLFRQAAHSGKALEAKVTKVLLRVPDRQPWPWNDQGDNKFRNALLNTKKKAIKLLWLKWGKEKERVSNEGKYRMDLIEVQLSEFDSVAICKWILRVFWTPQIWPSIMGIAVTTEGKKQIKMRKKKEGKPEAYMNFSSQKLFLIHAI